MSRTVVWSPRATRELRRLDAMTIRRVLAALSRYAETNYGDVIQLEAADPPLWRLRVGDHRVVFERGEDATTLHILHVLHRREAYRD